MPQLWRAKHTRILHTNRLRRGLASSTYHTLTMVLYYLGINDVGVIPIPSLLPDLTFGDRLRTPTTIRSLNTQHTVLCSLTYEPALVSIFLCLCSYKDNKRQNQRYSYEKGLKYTICCNIHMYSKLYPIQTTYTRKI